MFIKNYYEKAICSLNKDFGPSELTGNSYPIKNNLKQMTEILSGRLLGNVSEEISTLVW